MPKFEAEFYERHEDTVEFKVFFNKQEKGSQAVLDAKLPLFMKVKDFKRYILYRREGGPFIINHLDIANEDTLSQLFQKIKSNEVDIQTEFVRYVVFASPYPENPDTKPRFFRIESQQDGKRTFFTQASTAMDLLRDLKNTIIDKQDGKEINLEKLITEANNLQKKNLIYFHFQLR